MAKADKRLLQDAQAAATGATAHAVNEATCNYEAACAASEGEAWWEKNRTDAMKTLYAKLADEWETYIRKSMASGEYNKTDRPQRLF